MVSNAVGAEGTIGGALRAAFLQSINLRNTSLEAVCNCFPHPRRL